MDWSIQDIARLAGTTSRTRRGLGLGLPVIRQVLDDETDAANALTGHLAWLKQEQVRLARQIASVTQTLEAVKGGGEIMAEDMFNGFDHTQYKDEVEERWGKDAYAKGDAWWCGMSADGKAEWKQRSQRRTCSPSGGSLPANRLGR